jgi:hypothetical protein
MAKKGGGSMSRRKPSPPVFDVTDRIVRVSIALDRINRLARGEELPPDQVEFAFSFTTNTHDESPDTEPSTR